MRLNPKDLQAWVRKKNVDFTHDEPTQAECTKNIYNFIAFCNIDIYLANVAWVMREQTF